MGVTQFGSTHVDRGACGSDQKRPVGRAGWGRHDKQGGGTVRMREEERGRAYNRRRGWDWDTYIPHTPKKKRNQEQSRP